MLSLIIGGQRQGKSCFAVKKLKMYLLDSNRPIYSNLPLHPDVIAKQLVTLNGNPLNKFDAVIPILERIHIFRKFQKLIELREWYAKNYFWCGMHTGRSRGRMVVCKRYYDLNSSLCERLSDQGFIIIPDEFDVGIDINTWELDSSIATDNRLFYPLIHVITFWTVSKSNCIHFYDEVYEIFSKINQGDRGQKNKDHREKLLKYSKQHGHYKDDMYLITHDPADVDDIVRKSVGFTYECFNSLDRNIIEDEMMKKYPFISLTFKGMKNLMFFFIIYGYEKGAKSATDYWRIFPKQRDFACYDSFSLADLGGKMSADSKAQSSDIHRSKFKMLYKWLCQSWPNLLIVFVFLSLGVIIVRGLSQFLNTDNNKGSSLVNSCVKSTAVNLDEVKSNDSASSDDSAGGSEKEDKKEEKEKPRVTGVTPNCVYFSDGLKIVKGGVYEYKNKVFDVIKISKNFVTLGIDDSKFKVSMSGLR